MQEKPSTREPLIRPRFGSNLGVMDFLKALWRGEVALVKTYWLFGAVGSLLLLEIPEIFFEVSGLNETTDPVALVTLATYGLILAPAFTIIISVAIWRSANRYTGSIWWAGLAKLSVVTSIVRFIMGIAEEFQ